MNVFWRIKRLRATVPAQHVTQTVNNRLLMADFFSLINSNVMCILLEIIIMLQATKKGPFMLIFVCQRMKNTSMFSNYISIIN